MKVVSSHKPSSSYTELFSCILPHPTRTYLILPHSTPYYTASYLILPGPTLSYPILPHITLDSTASYPVLPCPTSSYPIYYTGFNCILPHPTRCSCGYSSLKARLCGGEKGACPNLAALCDIYYGCWLKLVPV